MYSAQIVWGSPARSWRVPPPLNSVGSWVALSRPGSPRATLSGVLNKLILGRQQTFGRVCVCVCAFGMVFVVAYMFTCARADLCIFGSQRRSSASALIVHRESMTVNSCYETASLPKCLQRSNRPMLAAILAEVRWLLIENYSNSRQV